MIPAERRGKILVLLQNKKFLSVNEISKELHVSKATVRRDLIEMDQQGVIIRSRGGAVAAQKSTVENTYWIRENEKQKEKKTIADMASTFIEDGFSLFLDSSSTVSAIIPFLNTFKNLTIITNGIKTALDLSQFKEFNIVLIGGNLLPGSSSTVGITSSDTISRYKVDLCLLSCRGIDLEGVYEANEQQAMIKQKMLQNSKKNLLLCDSSKFDYTYFFKMTEANKFDYIITEKIPEHYTSEILRSYGALIIES